MEMFRYCVYVVDFNRAGEREEEFVGVYHNRIEALNTKRKADDEAMGSYIIIELPGPDGWHSPLRKKEAEEEQRKFYEYMTNKPEYKNAPIKLPVSDECYDVNWDDDLEF